MNVNSSGLCWWLDMCFICKTSTFLLIVSTWPQCNEVISDIIWKAGWFTVLKKSVSFFFFNSQVTRLLRLAQIGSMDLVRRTRCFVWPVSMGFWSKRPSALRTKPLMSTDTLCFTPTSSPAQVNWCWRWTMKQSLSDTDSYWRFIERGLISVGCQYMTG